MLEHLPEPIDKNICILMRKASELSAEDFQILEKALKDPRWGNDNLTNNLNQLGFKVQKDAVRRHRTEACICVR